MTELDVWPICTKPGCDEEVDPRRAAALKRWGDPVTCLECGSKAADHGCSIIEVPKSNPMVIRPGTDIRGIASSHKGNRQAL